MGVARWLIMFAAVGACSADAPATDKSPIYALYRNSVIDSSLRLHWATFDADDSITYNMNNCLMAARLLNANVTASAAQEGKARHVGVGFWCEPGRYREAGLVPTNFPEAFPTDV